MAGLFSGVAMASLWPGLVMLHAGPLPYTPPDFGGAVARPPVTQWIRPLPGARLAGTSHSEFGRPAVAANHLFLGSAGADALYRISRADGAVTGSYAAGAPVLSQPVLLADAILFSDSAGYTWRYPVDGDGTHAWRHFGGAPILSEPVVADDLLYVHDLEDAVFALDVQTGESRWRYSHPPDLGRDSDLSLYGASSPVVAGEAILVGFHDGRVAALDGETGEVQWERAVGEGRYPDIIGEPVVDAGVVYSGGFSGPFVAFGLADQGTRWRLEVGTASAATLDGAHVLVGGSDGVLRAVDRLDGSVAWTWDSETEGALTRPMVTEAGVLVGSSDGSVWLVDRADGTLRWTYDEGFMLDGVSVAPVVAGRQVFVVTNAANLVAMVVPAVTAPVGPAAWAPFTSRR